MEFIGILPITTVSNSRLIGMLANLDNNWSSQYIYTYKCIFVRIFLFISDTITFMYCRVSAVYTLLNRRLLVNGSLETVDVAIMCTQM